VVGIIGAHVKSTDGVELARGAKGLIRMEGSQTIIEAPQADDGHASSRSAGKKPQIFSFGEPTLEGSQLITR